MTDWPNPNTNPEYYDPFASADRHPMLPCGLNSVDMDGDDVNGSGINFPVWPLLFQTYEGFDPIILTDERMAVFDGHADLVFACQHLEIGFPFEPNVYLAGGPWPVFNISPADNTIIFPAVDRAYVVSQVWTDHAASPVADATITLPAGTTTQPIKELT